MNVFRENRCRVVFATLSSSSFYHIHISHFDNYRYIDEDMRICIFLNDEKFVSLHMCSGIERTARGGEARGAPPSRGRGVINRLNASLTLTIILHSLIDRVQLGSVLL